jgi:hypothetical protein
MYFTSEFTGEVQVCEGVDLRFLVDSSCCQLAASCAMAGRLWFHGQTYDFSDGEVVGDHLGPLVKEAALTGGGFQLSSHDQLIITSYYHGIKQISIAVEQAGVMFVPVTMQVSPDLGGNSNLEPHTILQVKMWDTCLQNNEGHVMTMMVMAGGTGSPFTNKRYQKADFVDAQVLVVSTNGWQPTECMQPANSR